MERGGSEQMIGGFARDNRVDLKLLSPKLWRNRKMALHQQLLTQERFH